MTTPLDEAIEQLRKCVTDAKRVEITLGHSALRLILSEVERLRGEVDRMNEQLATMQVGDCHYCKTGLQSRDAFRCFDCRFLFCAKCAPRHLTDDTRPGCTEARAKRLEDALRGLKRAVEDGDHGEYDEPDCEICRALESATAALGATP